MVTLLPLNVGVCRHWFGPVAVGRWRWKSAKDVIDDAFVADELEFQNLIDFLVNLIF